MFQLLHNNTSINNKHKKHHMLWLHVSFCSALWDTDCIHCKLIQKRHIHCKLIQKRNGSLYQQSTACIITVLLKADKGLTRANCTHTCKWVFSYCNKVTSELHLHHWMVHVVYAVRVFIHFLCSSVYSCFSSQGVCHWMC